MHAAANNFQRHNPFTSWLTPRDAGNVPWSVRKACGVRLAADPL
jgi:hypothetical protein